MTARQLLAWGDLDDRRRRAARRSPLARISPWLVSCLGGVLLAAEIHRRLGGFGEAAAGAATAGGTLRLWLAVTLAGHVLVLFGSPHRLFWRRDSALLARLPIPGQALFRLALYRSARAAARVALPAAIAALAFAPALGWTVAARLALLVLVAALGAGLLGPAAALAAGAVVASDKAQAMLGEISGEFRAPRTSWLGILPGVAGSALVVALVVLAPWAAGAPMAAAPVGLAIALGLPFLTAAWGLARAGRIMPAALREVSALDQERLAHIERSTPSRLERAWFGAVLRSAGARLVAHKDAALTRRRFPSPYFIAPVGAVALWIMAGVGGERVLPWASVVLFGLAVYALLMARRLVTAPVEIPRLLPTLPIGPGEVRGAKRSAVLLRALVWIGPGGIPLAILHPLAWVVVGSAFAVAALGGILSLSQVD
jgi:hypothetical protein